MMNRRTLLTTGGAGVAALALPSFFSRGRGTALAQAVHDHSDRRTDPMLAELVSQLHKVYVDLNSPGPKTDARHIATLFRMGAAWGEQVNLTARINQLLADKQAKSLFADPFVVEMTKVDRAAEMKARGYKIPPNFRSHLTPKEAAFAVAALKGGFTLEGAWRMFGAATEARADQINQMLRGGDSLLMSKVRLPQDQNFYPYNITGTCIPVYQTYGDGGGSEEVLIGYSDCYFVAQTQSGDFEFSMPSLTLEQCRTLQLNGAAAMVSFWLGCAIVVEACILGFIFGFVISTLQAQFCP
jgi:hypothetical protein